MTSDASNVAYGSVLEQITDLGECQPVAFFSGKFTDAQLSWASFDKELYVIYSGCEHFEHLIEGRDVVLVTDHKPLLSIFRTVHKFPRRSRNVEFISQFSTNIVHIAGTANVIADMLSRPSEVDEITQPLSFVDLVKEQNVDDEVISIKNNGYRDHTIRSVRIHNDNVLCSVFQEINRPIIPKKFRLHVFKPMISLTQDKSLR